MAIGGSFSGINFAGLASGLDTETIIQRLMQIQSRPIARLRQRQGQIQAKMSAFEQFKAGLQALQTAGSALGSTSGFNVMKAVSSDTAVATVTASTDALAGIYELAVSKLAQAQKVITESHASSSTALGLAGSFLINGKQIDVVESDTLAAIAGKINQANAGVNASIINGSSTETFLVVSSKETGANNTLRISDLGNGTVLNGLKIQNTTASIKHAVTNGAQSDRFTAADQTIKSLLGITGSPSGTVQINGTNIAIDFATDTLTSLATKINEAGITGVSASVVTETDGGTTYYRLKITGASTPTFTDDQNLLKNVGILQNDFRNQLVAAQDAEFTLDGISFKRSKNAITDVIQGTTVTLLAADATTPKRSTLTFERDTGSIKKNITDFVGAFNQVADFLKAVATYDKETQRTGILFGDSTIQSVHDGLIRRFIEPVQGLSGTLTSLAQIGITLDNQGKLVSNDTALDAALNGDIAQIGQLFYANGRSDSALLSFISSTHKTRPSTTDGYLVNITQAATRAIAAADEAQTQASTEIERLTFSGAMFGDTPYTIALSAGNTIDDTINQINSDAKLKNLLTASKDGDGKLVLTAKEYGSRRNFEVVSDLAAAPNTTGLGMDTVGAEGLDVAGSINGIVGEGDGQFLVVRQSNTDVEGMQIRFTGATTGEIGRVFFSRGSADAVRTYITNLTDSISGDLTTNNTFLTEQVDSIERQITQLQEQVDRKAIELRKQFSRLEGLMSQFQSQSQRLAAMLGQAQR